MSKDPTRWRIVTSPKPQRAGEYFIMRGEKFVLKLYRDAVPDPTAFTRRLIFWLNSQDVSNFEVQDQDHDDAR